MRTLGPGTRCFALLISTLDGIIGTLTSIIGTLSGMISALLRTPPSDLRWAYHDRGRHGRPLRGTPTRRPCIAEASLLALPRAAAAAAAAACGGRHQLHAEAPWLERCVGTLNQPERKARRGGRRCPPVHSATAATCSRRQPPHRRGVARIARRWLQLNESAAAYESVPVKKLLLLLSKLCGETLVRDTAPSSPRPPLRHLWR